MGFKVGDKIRLSEDVFGDCSFIDTDMLYTVDEVYDMSVRLKETGDVVFKDDVAKVGDKLSLNLRELQEKHCDWSDENFGDVTGHFDRGVLHCALGAAEEIGELCHGVLKAEQGIRGSVDDHRDGVRDAIGDIVLYLIDLCGKLGLDFEAVLQDVSEEVHGRNWNENKKDGTSE